MLFNAISGLDFLVDVLRYRIADPKYSYTSVVRENAGLSVGTVPELFETDNLPIASGQDTHLRIGRYYYTKFNSEAETSGKRGYVFIHESGVFKVPSVAVAGTSGSRAEISYTWVEEQECQFSDVELKMYIGEAIESVNSLYYDFGFSFVVTGTSASDMSVTPAPTTSDIGGYMYVHYASYLIKKQLEAEGYGDRIYVKDITTTIDTSKGLGDLSKSSKELLSFFDSIITEMKLKGQEAAFARLDNYSTYRGEWTGALYDRSYREDPDLF